MGWGLLIAVPFVLVCGANDGAVLLGLALRAGLGRAAPLLAPTTLVLSLVTVPVLFGYGVAGTFTGGLAGLSGGPFLGGVVTSLVVVGVLSWRALPTSLTLALVGGLTGAALGGGLAVSWDRVAVVLAAGLGAPLAGLVLGYLLGAGSRRVPGSSRMPVVARVLGVGSYALQCAAYAANDGQKMFAVLAVAVGGTPGWGWLVAVALVFCLGALPAVAGVGERLGRGLALLRPVHVMSAQGACAAAVLAGSALGSPVSMTQSLSAGAVGVAASEGVRRVRWPQVLRLGLAWVLTLPSALALGAVAGLLTR
ncbi:MAG: inorganic phosphate transporter [Thermoactinospora sp.]|nr:inorganic phosphate transporter [Thermoactinospora sp.]